MLFMVGDKYKVRRILMFSAVLKVCNITLEWSDVAPHKYGKEPL